MSCSRIVLVISVSVGIIKNPNSQDIRYIIHRKKDLSLSETDKLKSVPLKKRFERSSCLGCDERNQECWLEKDDEKKRKKCHNRGGYQESFSEFWKMVPQSFDFAGEFSTL